MALTKEDIMSVKGRGFLQNRGTELFSGRCVAKGAVFTAAEFKTLGEIAEKFGNGKVICTSRLNVEVPGIPFDKIPDAEQYALERGLKFGGTGAKIRPVTACKGSTCVYGNCDTHGIAAKIHDEFYIGWNSVKLPHKFKIGVGGCPNSCMKPSLNDVGIEGHKVPVINAEKCRGCGKCAVEQACPMKCAKVVDGKITIDTSICMTCGVCTGKCPFGGVENQAETVYKIYVGGTWGKRTRMGTPLSRFVTEDEIYPIIAKVMLWFKENAYAKERLGIAIDRVGIEQMEKAVFSDDLLKRKDEIISAPILEK